MEREVGGGTGMGNTCKPMAVSFQCMTKYTTNKKKINKKNKKKINIHLERNGKKKKKITLISLLKNLFQYFQKTFFQ